MTTIAIPGALIAIAGAALLALVVGAVIALVPSVHLHRAAAEDESTHERGSAASVYTIRPEATAEVGDGTGKRERIAVVSPYRPAAC